MKFDTAHLHGVYAAVPTAWDDTGRFDPATFQENAARLIAAGVHGVYTTGTDGEWYAVESDDFRRMVDAFAAEVRNQSVGSQIGVTWINTEGVLARARYAAERGNRTVQVALPMWLKLSEADVVHFFRDLAHAVPDVGIVHYNTRYAKNFLTAADYRRIRGEVSNLIGTKFLGSLNELIDVVDGVPELIHFTDEEAHAPGRFLGAQGVYTWLANIHPEISLAIHEACERRNWVEAMRLQRRVRQLAAAIQVFESSGYSPAASSSAINKISGFLQENLVTRPPYRPMTPEDAARMEELLRREFPEFLWSESRNKWKS